MQASSSRRRPCFHQLLRVSTSATSCFDVSALSAPSPTALRSPDNSGAPSSRSLPSLCFPSAPPSSDKLTPESHSSPSLSQACHHDCHHLAPPYHPLAQLYPSGLPGVTSSSPTPARIHRDPFHLGQVVWVGFLLHFLLFLDLHSLVMFMSLIVDHLVSCFPQNRASP